MEIDDTTKQQNKKTALTFDSNPFTTSVRGMRKLFELNGNSLAGLALCVFAMILLVFGVVIALFAGSLRYFRNMIPTSGTWDFSTSTYSPDMSFISHMGATPAWIGGWLIGVLVIVGLFLVVHLMALRLGLASVAEKTITTGTLVRQAASRFWAGLGLLGSLILLLAAPAVILALLFQVIGWAALVLIIIVALLYIYAFLRFSFAWLLVADGRGPIAALEESWTLSGQHFFETIGVVCTNGIIVLTPLLILQFLMNETGGIMAGILGLIMGIAALISSAVVAAGLSERLAQLRAVRAGTLHATKTHPLNYLAIVILLILIGISGALKQNTYYPMMPMQQPYACDTSPYSGACPSMEPQSGWPY